MFISLVLLYHLFAIGEPQESQSPECRICMDIAGKARRQGSDLEWMTKQKALLGANAYTGAARDLYINETNCHWRKYYKDANFNPQASLLSTCADTGFCPLSYQHASFNAVDITNITLSYYETCTNPQSIVIHHTVTPTAEETIKILTDRGLSVQYIVAQNGTIYQMVRDWFGAWHAGAGNWRELVSLNTKCVGIENVNDGASPFSQAQIDSLILLVNTLRKRWHIADGYIIGHMEISPHVKDDPSGYFPWQYFYSGLNVYPGLFQSNLTEAEKQQVLLSNCTWDEFTTNRVQDGLQRYGFTTLPMTPGIMDENTMLNIQSFNRHFCPEIFKKEAFNSTSQTNIQNPSNRQWYSISDERLNYLLRQL